MSIIEAGFIKGTDNQVYVVGYWANNDWRNASPSDSIRHFVFEMPSDYNYALIDIGGTSKQNRRNIMAATEWLHEYAMGNGGDDEDFETPVDHYIFIRWPKDCNMPEGSYHITEYVSESYVSYGKTRTLGDRFKYWKQHAEFHQLFVQAVKTSFKHKRHKQPSKRRLKKRAALTV